MVRLRTGNNKWNTHMHKKLKIVLSAAFLFCEKDWQTTEHLFCKRQYQEGAAARHYSRNYLMTDSIVHSYYWPDPVTANEKKKMQKLCTMFITILLTFDWLFISYINLLVQTIKYFKINKWLWAIIRLFNLSSLHCKETSLLKVTWARFTE